jgi:hypothetical protein
MSVIEILRQPSLESSRVQSVEDVELAYDVPRCSNQPESQRAGTSVS